MAVTQREQILLNLNQMQGRPKESTGTEIQLRFLASWYLLGCLVFPALPAKSQPFGGVITLSTVNFLGNNVTFDSFDSSTNTHSIWQTNWLYHGQPYGSWSNGLSFNTNSLPSRTANCMVATQGTNIFVGNASIAGYVDTAPGGTVSLSSRGSVGDLKWAFILFNSGIQPGHQRDDMNTSFFSYNLPIPPLINGWQNGWKSVTRTATLFPGTTNVVNIGGTWTNISGIWTDVGGTLYTNTGSGWVIGGVTYTAIITNAPANTNYYFYAYQPVTGTTLSENLFVDGQYQVLWIPGGIRFSGSTTLTLNTNSDVQIWTGSDIDTTGGGIINNLTKYVPAFRIYDINSEPVNIKLAGSGFGTGYIYAPSSSLQFSGGGAGTYDVVGAIVCHDLRVLGQYNFHFDEALGMNLPPWIGTQPTNQIVQAGTNATFTVNAGGPSPNYQWFFNQTNPISYGITPALVLTNVQMTNAGNYSVIVTNSIGSITSAPASLVVWTDATPTLSAVATPTNGQFQFNLAGVTGLNYGVQVSTDLVSWVPVATNISPFIFADTNANLSSQRFYRSVYSP